MWNQIVYMIKLIKLYAYSYVANSCSARFNKITVAIM